MDEVICKILHFYPSVNLRQFSIGFKAGGLTYPQIEKLFELRETERTEEFRIIGAFHGIDISGDGKKSVSREELPTGIDKPEHFVFGDPDSYKGYSQEEKEALTQKMIDNHRQWAPVNIGGEK